MGRKRVCIHQKGSGYRERSELRNKRSGRTKTPMSGTWWQFLSSSLAISPTLACTPRFPPSRCSFSFLLFLSHFCFKQPPLLASADKHDTNALQVAFTARKGQRPGGRGSLACATGGEKWALLHIQQYNLDSFGRVFNHPIC